MTPFRNLAQIFCLFFILILQSCTENESKPSVEKHGVENSSLQSPAADATPVFSEDSAYTYVKKQVDFGPRTPNSFAHDACEDYLVAVLESFNWKVKTQKGEQVAHDGVNLKFSNIIASINPESKKRILLTAHWDTRPWADNDADESEHSEPIDGANDGASGVGVLLEIARVLKGEDLSIGVDIVLFDIEDYGISSSAESFCYGSQYWAKNSTYKGVLPYFGINLDMVGDKKACFSYEGYSNQYARHVLDKVWGSAHALGYERMFLRDITYPVTDDHLYVNQAGIPCIDLIHRDKVSGRFPESWHTHDDTMDNIYKPTLKAVGQTVLRVLYLE
jgi:Zn-dependent M28 family amino/carboxypeptidase